MLNSQVLTVLLGFSFLRLFLQHFATLSKIGNFARYLKSDFSKRSQAAWQYKGSVRAIILAVTVHNEKKWKSYFPVNIYNKNLTPGKFWFDFSQFVWERNKDAGGPMVISEAFRILISLGGYIFTS